MPRFFFRGLIIGWILIVIDESGSISVFAVDSISTTRFDEPSTDAGVLCNWFVPSIESDDDRLAINLSMII
jgi:hypothetical protein